MPAARDFDWSHIHVLGDRDAAVPYVGVARKMLGYVKQDAQYNKLGVHSLTRSFDDGTVITAEIHGTIPRITIQTAPPPSPDEVDLGGIVVVPRNGHSADPISVQNPEEVLQTHQHRWRTLFYDGTSATFKAYKRPKGIYKRALKNGVHYAGNIDWTDGKGLHISWYGPSRRYWYDMCVIPQGQYSGFVFVDGVIVFDVSKVVGHETSLVVGASLVKNVLLVMLADMPDPRVGTYAHDYPDQSAIDVVLYEFHAEKADGTYKVNYTTKQQRWAFSAIGMVNPWMTSPDGKTWISMSFDPTASHDFPESPYYDPATWHELNIQVSGAVAHSTKECVPDENGNDVSLLIAVDFNKDGSRCEVRTGFTYTTTPQILGSTQFDLDFNFDPMNSAASMAFLQSKYNEAKNSMAGKYVGVLQRSECYYQVGSTRQPMEVVQEFAYGSGIASANKTFPTPQIGVANFGYFKGAYRVGGENTHVIAIDARHSALVAVGIVANGIVVAHEGAQEIPSYEGENYSGNTDSHSIQNGSGQFSVRIFARVEGVQREIPITTSGDGYTPYLANDAGYLYPYDSFMPIGIVQEFDPAAVGTQLWQSPGDQYCYSVEDRRRKIYPAPNFRGGVFSPDASYSAKADGYMRTHGDVQYEFNAVDSDIPNDKTGRHHSVYLACDDHGNFVFSASVPMPIFRQYEPHRFYRQIRRPKVFISNFGSMVDVTGVAAKTATFDAWCSKAWVLSKRKRTSDIPLNK